MKAVVFHAPRKVSVEEVLDPVPGPGRVTVKVHGCGICGTDLHIYDGEFIARYPLIPGHEFSGVVHEVGSDVAGIEPGQPVTVDPSLPCGECYYCRRNEQNQCERWNAVGVTVPGGFAEYVAVPAQNVYPLPEEVSLDEGAFTEPLACVVYALYRLRVRLGDRVLIFGAGPMGLLLQQVITHSGAAEVVTVDVAPPKLEMAGRLGASRTVLASEAPALLLRDYPRGFDVVVDATGVPAVIESMFRYAGPRARILQFGVAPSDAHVRVSPFEIYRKDWEIYGSMALVRTFQPAIALLKGVVKVAPLITRRIRLEQMPATIAQPKEERDLKILVQP